LEGYCRFDPGSDLFFNLPAFKDPAWKKGEEYVFQSGASYSAGVTSKRYIIQLPKVTQEYETYNFKIDKFNPNGIVFRDGSEIESIQACGCVQTGGSGRHTWKDYVNPQGDNSDRLYHGVVLLPPPSQIKVVQKPGQAPLKYSPFLKGAVRIGDLANWLSGGGRIVFSTNAHLVLGYEDDDYPDNGYWGHDDGNNNQCQHLGGAVIEISVKNPG
jgi:hypothetical protein